MKNIRNQKKTLSLSALVIAALLSGCNEDSKQMAAKGEHGDHSPENASQDNKAINLKWTKSDTLTIRKKMIGTLTRIERAETDQQRAREQSELDKLKSEFDGLLPAVRQAVDYVQNHPGDLSDQTMDAMMLIMAAARVAEGEVKALAGGSVGAVEQLLLTEAGSTRLMERSVDIDNDLFDLETIASYSEDTAFLDTLFVTIDNKRLKDAMVVSATWNLNRFVSGTPAQRQAYRIRNHLYTDYYLAEYGAPEKVEAMSEKARRDYWIVRGARFHVDNLDIGDTVPELEVTDLQGQPVAAADHSNKWRILDFWTTDCAFCKKAMPDKLVLVNELPKDQFEYISIACDQEAEDVLLYQEEDFAMPWTNWHLPAETERGFSWAIRSYPTYFIVSPDGKIMKKSSHFPSISAAMEGYLKE
ncbi:TlpA disulfide reductase family protein [Porticoccus sp. W117]|nr:TlpA disulfide reductase family protein [Porticoccus sp. W117]